MALYPQAAREQEKTKEAKLFPTLSTDRAEEDEAEKSDRQHRIGFTMTGGKDGTGLTGRKADAQLTGAKDGTGSTGTKADA
uniref:Uncharacterized protein n=1 Tax=Ditylenchus dipsaci TaxID=166011 RepID=A0A915DG68_9BILA